LARGHYISFCEAESLNLTLDCLQFETWTQKEDDVPRLQLRAQFIVAQNSKVISFHKHMRIVLLHEGFPQGELMG
jgi:hypothetical protein